MKCKYFEDLGDSHTYCKCNGNLPDSPSWKSVRDELPKEDGDYIVFRLDGEITIHRYYAGDFDNTGWYESAYNKTGTVTHWQPLPSPPEVKGE